MHLVRNCVQRGSLTPQTGKKHMTALGLRAVQLGSCKVLGLGSGSGLRGLSSLGCMLSVSTEGFRAV